MEEGYIRHFENRRIALAGNKRMCRHFYLQFHSILDINYYIFTKYDQMEGEVKGAFEDIPEIECRYMKALDALEQDLLIILCTDHALRKDYDHLFFQQGLEWGFGYIDALYVVQYYRHKYNMELFNKNLWIYGAGNNGKYFYRKYGSVYSIAGFISNFEEERECQGLPVIRPEALLKQENAYVVICSDADAMMAEKLCELGLIGNKDFCFPEMISKALFHAVGTCQIVNSAEVLYQNEDFYPRYYGCSYFDNVYEPCSDADNRRIKAYGSFCDVVFYNIANAGTTEFRNYRILINDYYKNAKQLFLPFYYFKGQMMQATDGVNPYALKSYEEEQFWFRGDQEINHMVEHGCGMEEIISKVLKSDYWSEQEIRNHFRQELKKIEILDRFSSIPIKSFIEENYKKMSVFADGTHFNFPLYLYIANEAANALQIEQITDQGYISEIKYDLSVMPIYPCVQKALEMEEQHSYPFYNKEKRTVEYLDIEEYLRRYVDYVMAVCNMYKKNGTHFR